MKSTFAKDIKEGTWFRNTGLNTMKLFIQSDMNCDTFSAFHFV